MWEEDAAEGSRRSNTLRSELTFRICCASLRRVCWLRHDGERESDERFRRDRKVTSITGSVTSGSFRLP